MALPIKQREPQPIILPHVKPRQQPVVQAPVRSRQQQPVLLPTILARPLAEVQRFCGQCGTSVEAGYCFCGQCGTRLR
jgi:hypothetical protein